MDPTQIVAFVAVLLTAAWALSLLALLSRVSMWTRATQEKLDRTNEMLERIAGGR